MGMTGVCKLCDKQMPFCSYIHVQLRVLLAAAAEQQKGMIGCLESYLSLMPKIWLLFIEAQINFPSVFILQPI